MEIQVFDSENGEIIAWIDTKSGETVCKDGYDVKSGEDLRAAEVGEDLQVTGE